ncbi:hypothetical protein COMA1_40397 [Candidatus Nitrospira nitrosa]|uniref:Outer membrane chaperone Skp n=1 Tax=Candidatus Nitrospira nitrosa TaxID=1742972 RepID=A0A0S4LNG2_9BACT|nr:OmpH family outer membrane protein [Candidatus Nitrospira nitrosa]CUS38072.1 hypothetical protein COMA1_40397 [Candidatus Nitrospira nitrosa]
MAQLVLVLFLLFFPSCRTNVQKVHEIVRGDANISSDSAPVGPGQLTSDDSVEFVVYHAPTMLDVRNATRIGSVNMYATVEQTQYGRFLLQSMKELAFRRQRTLNETEARLRREESSIQQLKSQSNEEWKKRDQVLRQEVEKFKVMASDFNQEVAVAQQNFVQQFKDRVLPVIEKIASQKGLELVIDPLEGSPQATQARKALTPMGKEILERPLEDLTLTVVGEMDKYP